MSGDYLLMKRGLFYRPNAQGYTGIRDHAGRYAEAEAIARSRDGEDGVTMVLETEAPEFTASCYDDLARDHLTRQRDEARARIAVLEKALKPFAAFADALNDRIPDDIAIGIFAEGAMRFGPSGGVDLGSLRAARAAISGPISGPADGVKVLKNAESLIRDGGR
jgi:hypothetical protein